MRSKHFDRGSTDLAGVGPPRLDLVRFGLMSSIWLPIGLCPRIFRSNPRGLNQIVVPRVEIRLRPRCFGPKSRGLSQFRACPRGFAPKPRTLEPKNPKCAQTYPWGDLAWGARFLEPCGTGFAVFAQNCEDRAKSVLILEVYA